MSKPHVSIRQSITYGREPGELKHLKYVKRRDRDETRRCESSGQVEKPRNNKPSDINAIVSEEAKQERAQGGCLGTKSR